MRIGGFSLESFKFGVYIIAPIIAVYIFSVPDVFLGVINNRSYIRYRPQAILDDDDEADLREQVETTEADLDNLTAKRIDAYVQVGREEQRRQLVAVRDRLMKQMEQAGEADEEGEEAGGEAGEGDRA